MVFKKKFFVSKSQNSRSQSAIEFIALTSVVIFFMTISFAVLNENAQDKYKQKRNLEIQEIALSVQDEINLALESSEGYQRRFKVPSEINGESYKINITEGMIYVRSNDDKQAIGLPIPAISGQILKGYNLIKKQGGIIYLNP